MTKHDPYLSLHIELLGRNKAAAICQEKAADMRERMWCVVNMPNTLMLGKGQEFYERKAAYWYRQARLIMGIE